MKCVCVCVVLLTIAGLRIAAAEPVFSDVFVPASDGYKSIRIPAVIVTNTGTILAFAEGRAASTDQAHNKIIQKSSSDGGATWSAVRLVAVDGDNSLNNPTAVVERQSGRVFLMYQRIPAHLKEHSKNIATGYDGPDIYRNFLTGSDDDGKSWSTPLDVTAGTKHATGATTIASGPGIGIQLERGPHKGRLVIPFNEGPYGIWNDYAVFSDDRGASWKCGANVPGAMTTDAKGAPRSQINEVQIAELSNGSLRLNARQFAGAKVRKTSISRDGGETWSAVEDVPDLRDPSCMGSVLRFSFAETGGKSILLYSGPDSTQRENGTLHASFDEGATWPAKRVLYKEGFAYSVLTRLPNGNIGCLFEADKYARIVFARVSMDWLMGEKGK
jgi:sialidase-1